MAVGMVKWAPVIEVIKTFSGMIYLVEIKRFFNKGSVNFYSTKSNCLTVNRTLFNRNTFELTKFKFQVEI